MLRGHRFLSYLWCFFELFTHEIMSVISHAINSPFASNLLYLLFCSPCQLSLYYLNKFFFALGPWNGHNGIQEQCFSFPQPPLSFSDKVPFCCSEAVLFTQQNSSIKQAVKRSHSDLTQLHAILQMTCTMTWKPKEIINDFNKLQKCLSHKLHSCMHSTARR